MQVKMLQAAMNAGALLSAGVTYDLAESVALDLIGSRRADRVTAVDYLATPVGFTGDQGASLRASVSEYGNIAALQVAADAGLLTPGGLCKVGSAARYFCRSATEFSLVPLTIADAIGGAPRTVTGTTVETTLFSKTIPADFFHKNAVLMVRPDWEYTNSANNKILKVKVGGVQVIALTATTTAEWYRETFVRWRNSYTSQIMKAIGNTSIHGNGTGAMATATIDPSAGVLIEVTGQLASAGESITLQAFDIEVK